MATVGTHGTFDSATEGQVTSHRAMAIGGGAVESLCGVAAVVLAILGLVNIMPVFMAGVATIVVGMALLFEGAALTGRCMRAFSAAQPGTEAEHLGAGLTVEFLGGATGVVLGVLALLNLMPTTLIPVAAIVFGTAMLLGARVPSFSESFRGWTHGSAEWMAHEAVNAAIGVHVLVGLSAAILGILALVGEAWLPLSLVAMLILGASTLLSGTAISSRVAAAFSHY